MFLNKKLALLALCTSLSLVSCNEYQKALKSTDTKVKYDAAESFYKAGNYRQANRLFEQIAPKYIGKPQGERVLFFSQTVILRSKITIRLGINLKGS